MESQTRQKGRGLASVLRSVRNVRTLTTALGGVSIETYDRVLQLPSPAGLLPGLHDDLHSLSLEELLDGVRPDMLGELYVLDRLAASGTERNATTALLQTAWHTDPHSYTAFVERAVGDHREHDQLVGLLDIGDWSESPSTCAHTAVDIIPLLRRSNHPALEWIFTQLNAQRESVQTDELDELIITARFRFANLVMRENDYPRATARLCLLSLRRPTTADTSLWFGGPVHCGIPATRQRLITTSKQFWRCPTSHRNRRWLHGSSERDGASPAGHRPWQRRILKP